MRSRLLTTSLVVFTILCWSINFYMVPLAIAHLSVMAASAVRYTFGVITLAILFLFFGKKDGKYLRDHWPAMLLVGFVGMYVFNYLFFLGLKTTSAFNGSILMGLNPVTTALMAVLFMKVRLKNFQWTGIVASFLGACIVIINGQWATMKEIKIVEGDGYLFLANISFALHNVWVRKYLLAVPPLLTAFVSATFATALFYLTAWHDLASAPFATLPLSFYGSVIFMGVFATGLAYFFWNRGISIIGAPQAALFMNLIPVFTALISIGIGQTLSLHQIFGGMVVITGLFIFNGMIINRKK